MIEHKGVRLLPFAQFLRRVLMSIGAAAVLVAFALSAGAYGYRTTEHMGWLDAYLNAAMILTGMGPVDRLTSEAGKLFAIFYILASGFVVLTVGALLLGPVLHRLLHILHLESDEER